MATIIAFNQLLVKLAHNMTDCEENSIKFIACAEHTHKFELHKSEMIYK